MRCKVTVVILSVCLLPRNLLPTSFIRGKQGTLWFFMVFLRFLSCGFHWKRFFQELWCHLQVIAAFSLLAVSFSCFRRQKGLHIPFGLKKSHCCYGNSSRNMTGSSLILEHCRGFLAWLHCPWTIQVGATPMFQCCHSHVLVLPLPRFNVIVCTCMLHAISSA